MPVEDGENLGKKDEFSKDSSKKQLEAIVGRMRVRQWVEYFQESLRLSEGAAKYVWVRFVEVMMEILDL